MTIAEVREICISFPAVTEDIKWENHLCFNIGGKMFLVTSPDNVPVSASFKTSDEDFEALPNRAGFIPAPYMARNKWIFVDDINRFSKKEWESYLRKSYDLILSKLSLKFQKEITSGKAMNSIPKKKKVAAKKKIASKKNLIVKKKTQKKKKK
ncbi:MAG TPA: MmcQ/YjbR family DNA-binding protein [Cyclobacteriaceae bacterium]